MCSTAAAAASDNAELGAFEEKLLKIRGTSFLDMTREPLQSSGADADPSLPHLSSVPAPLHSSASALAAVSLPANNYGTRVSEHDALGQALLRHGLGLDTNLVAKVEREKSLTQMSATISHDAMKETLLKVAKRLTGNSARREMGTLTPNSFEVLERLRKTVPEEQAAHQYGYLTRRKDRHFVKAFDARQPASAKSLETLQEELAEAVGAAAANPQVRHRTALPLAVYTVPESTACPPQAEPEPVVEAQAAQPPEYFDDLFARISQEFHGGKTKAGTSTLAVPLVEFDLPSDTDEPAPTAAVLQPLLRSDEATHRPLLDADAERASRKSGAEDAARAARPQKTPTLLRLAKKKPAVSHKAAVSRPKKATPSAKTAEESDTAASPTATTDEENGDAKATPVKTSEETGTAVDTSEAVQATPTKVAASSAKVDVDAAAQSSAHAHPRASPTRGTPKKGGAALLRLAKKKPALPKAAVSSPKKATPSAETAAETPATDKATPTATPDEETGTAVDTSEAVQATPTKVAASSAKVDMDAAAQSSAHKPAAYPRASPMRGTPKKGGATLLRLAKKKPAVSHKAAVSRPKKATPSAKTAEESDTAASPTATTDEENGDAKATPVKTSEETGTAVDTSEAVQATPTKVAASSAKVDVDAAAQSSAHAHPRASPTRGTPKKGGAALLRLAKKKPALPKAAVSSPKEATPSAETAAETPATDKATPTATPDEETGTAVDTSEAVQATPTKVAASSAKVDVDAAAQSSAHKPAAHPRASPMRGTPKKGGATLLRLAKKKPALPK